MDADADADSDEWEYEYDTQETQDFYITLDLTSQVPPGQRRRFTSSAAAEEASEQDTVQILDLHSDNPLISHQDKLYSCLWASAVGTDLLFTLPREGAATAPSQPAESPTDPILSGPAKGDPLRATSDYRILAATPHRLIGTPSVRKAKTDHGTKTAAQRSAATTHQHQHLQKASQRAAQSDFLDRLAALKARRGDTDKVPTHTVNSVDRPRTIIRPFLAGTAAGESWRSTAWPASKGAQEDQIGTDDEGDAAEAGQGEGHGEEQDIDPEEAEHSQDSSHEDDGESHIEDVDARQTSPPSSASQTPSQPRRGAASLRGRGRGRGRARRNPRPLIRANPIEGLVGDADVSFAPRRRRSSKAKAAANTTQEQSSDDVEMGGV